MAKFIGREHELATLSWIKDKKTASFVLIRGRRRIGKSRLIKEYSKQFKQVYSFIGLAPTSETTNRQQLDEFSRQLTRELKAAKATYDDWSDVLYALGNLIVAEANQKPKTKNNSILLIFDEISWMGSKDDTFLAKIKNLWDQQLSTVDKLVFIICGSASSWIDKNILGNTGFVGRISSKITLSELPLSDCNKFWPKGISAYEKFKILSVTGGIPKYLEEIEPKISAEENIRRLCFLQTGFLIEEFQQIFTDIFLRKSKKYQDIIKVLANGPLSCEQIIERLPGKASGRVSEYLEELKLSGFISRDYTWDIKSTKSSKISNYRLSDNYLRFYMKYIEPNYSKINSNRHAFASLELLPAWSNVMGLQFENLVISNYIYVLNELSINPSDVINEGPFLQRRTNRIKGCQIDYMIQTKQNNIYVCEIKFSKNSVGCKVISEMKDKLSNLALPRGVSYRTVLIHINGVTDELLEEDYFTYIIDYSKFLDR